MLKKFESLFANISYLFIISFMHFSDDFLSSFVLQYFIIKNVFPLSLSFGNIWIFFLCQQCRHTRVYLLLSHEISFYERNKQFLWWNRRSCTIEAQTYVHIILITKQTKTTSSGWRLLRERQCFAQQSTLLTQHVTIWEIASNFTTFLSRHFP